MGGCVYFDSFVLYNIYGAIDSLAQKCLHMLNHISIKKYTFGDNQSEASFLLLCACVCMRVCIFVHVRLMT